MPLLKSNKNNTDANYDTQAPPPRKKSISSNRTGGFRSSNGLFGRGRSSKKLLDKDPSIINARQRVSDAETAEKEADQALNEARSRVKLARDHVRILEQEAIEEARRAKAKQAETKIITKTMKGLGRHGP